MIMPRLYYARGYGFLAAMTHVGGKKSILNLNFSSNIKIWEHLY
jgi:hypothetical protein